MKKIETRKEKFDRLVDDNMKKILLSMKGDANFTSRQEDGKFVCFVYMEACILMARKGYKLVKK